MDTSRALHSWPKRPINIEIKIPFLSPRLSVWPFWFIFRSPITAKWCSAGLYLSLESSPPLRWAFKTRTVKVKIKNGNRRGFKIDTVGRIKAVHTAPTQSHGDRLSGIQLQGEHTRVGSKNKERAGEEASIPHVEGQDFKAASLSGLFNAQ